MALQIVGREARNVRQVQQALAGAERSEEGKMIKESGPIGGSKMTPAPNPRKRPVSALQDYAQQVGGQRARTDFGAAARTAAGGEGSGSVPPSTDILQKYFAGGEFPIPQLDRFAVMGGTDIDIYTYDDHAMSFGWKSNNVVTQMFTLSSEDYGDKFTSTEVMNSVLPRRTVLLAIRKPESESNGDPRIRVRHPGEINEYLLSRIGQNRLEAFDFLKNLQLMGAHIHTVAECEAIMSMIVYVTMALDGSCDLAFLWADCNEPVSVGTIVGFRYVERTRGFEEQEKRAQDSGRIWVGSSDPKLKYRRLEPCVHNGQGKPEREVYDWHSVGAPGLWIPLGPVESMPIMKTSLERYANDINNVMYPIGADGAAKAMISLKRLPTIRVSLKLLPRKTR